MDFQVTPDLGTLPEIVWVQVLKYLDLKDRYCASIACHNVYRAFNHPTLWRSVTLDVHKSKRFVDKVTVPKKNFHLLRKFGRIFKSVTFKVHAPLNTDFGEWNAILGKHQKEFNVSSVTFDVGGLINTSKAGGVKILTGNLKPMVEVVRNSKRLKSLIIKSWPISDKLFSNSDENVFEASMTNDNRRELNQLDLFGCDAVFWSERRPLLPPMDLTHKMVEHFQNLTHLSMRSPMMSEDLITCLSRDRQRLRELKIAINFIPDEDSFQLPKIRDSVWRDFASYNPLVQVHVLVLSRVPYLVLQQFLQASCPLHGIRFGQYVRSDKECVSYLGVNFTSTLESFEYHEEVSDFEQELVTLVENTVPLRYLKYYGKISQKHVIQLAEARGTAWLVFRLSRNNIYTVCKDSPGSEAESDQVIVQNKFGMYVLVNMLKFHEQTAVASDKEQELTMIEAVSSSLGREWFPDQP